MLSINKKDKKNIVEKEVEKEHHQKTEDVRVQQGIEKSLQKFFQHLD